MAQSQEEVGTLREPRRRVMMQASPGHRERGGSEEEAPAGETSLGEGVLWEARGGTSPERELRGRGRGGQQGDPGK